MEVYTIGFTKKTASDFFGALNRVHIKRLLDIRLNNVSQLAGFTKRDDLAYFLKELCGAEYRHEPLLAPTDDLLSAYRKKRMDWPTYESSFLQLMADRNIESAINPNSFAVPTALLCSEPTASKCHRRLVVEYLQKKWNGLKATHL